MSATLQVLTSAPAEVKLSNVSKKNLDPGFRLLTFRERVRMSITGCINHPFSWPQRLRFETRTFRYLLGYDSHQSCGHCGVKRFFNSKTLKAGPFFTETNIHPSSQNKGA